MITSLIFNKCDSVKDFGLYLTERPSIPLTLEDSESITIDGRSGTLTRSLGTYKDKTIPCKFRVISKENFYRNLDRIIEWFNYIEDNNLIFSFDEERIYKVKKVNCSDNITQQLDLYGDFEAKFICEPFKYQVNEDFITLTNNSTIYNVGNVYSEPYYKVYGTGNLTLTINDNTIFLNNINGYIELDVLKGLAYKDIYNYNYMDSTNGEFKDLQLQRGKNTINLSSNVTKIEVKPRWRFL
ncbi:hypothetical protein CSC2_12520 [Clostridium zeae]|uniref:Phage tail protein n=1 Tax=Clostridium zeae TaxID=2759022 RepID=A0ABQ1E7S5_9CLOT|nr:distal tail protein Dit [Clostridium zeae]GFZ30726.1 hypothetical protein CSC2_12520 [Clostridium zeae]